jgi:hypothetical protein
LQFQLQCQAMARSFGRWRNLKGDRISSLLQLNVLVQQLIATGYRSIFYVYPV